MATPKPGPGRTPKLDPAASKAICDAVAAGVPQKFAALRAGVGERTVRDWLTRGRREKSGPFSAFSAALKKARADAVARNVAVVQRAAAERDVVTVRETRRADGTVERVTTTRRELDWCAAAWWLERRYPKEFGRRPPREAADATGKAPPPLVVGGEADPGAL